MLRGSIPSTGIPMPLISAGGTSLMVFMAAIGILCNMGTGKKNMEEFKKSKMTINLFKSKKKKESDF